MRTRSTTRTSFPNDPKRSFRAPHSRTTDFIARTATTALPTALSSTYAEAGERIWRMGVLTPVDDGLVCSVILPYLAARGFIEGRNLVVDLGIGTAEQLPE
jgi:hypothetical protein